MIKSYSLLFYLLTLIMSFFIGMSLAALFGAAKNQGLAGGAIIFGYGVVAAIIGIIISLVIASKANKKVIIRLNLFFTLIITAFIVYIYFNKYRQNLSIESNENKSAIESIKTTQIAGFLSNNEKLQKQNQESFGIGIFSPNTFESSSLLLFENLNLNKSFLEHSPHDSISFHRKQNGGFEIATAPPYLVPEHMKLDYDVLMFKVVSLTHDFIEIEVNKITKQTAFVKKTSGNFKAYPEFFLSVNSVEFLNPQLQSIHIKALINSSTIHKNVHLMKPLKVRREWMYVLLIDKNQEEVGKGWIKWNENGKLIIKYNLFS